MPKIVINSVIVLCMDRITVKINHLFQSGVLKVFNKPLV